MVPPLNKQSGVGVGVLVAGAAVGVLVAGAGVGVGVLVAGISVVIEPLVFDNLQSNVSLDPQGSTLIEKL